MSLFGPPNIQALKNKRDLKGLIKALSYKDESIRASAAEALGELADPSSSDALAAAMQDDSWDVRYQTSLALVSMGDARGVDELMYALHGGAHGQYYSVSGEERQAAIAAIGKIRHPRAIELLGFAATNEDIYRRGVLIQGLGELGAQLTDENKAAWLAECLIQQFRRDQRDFSLLNQALVRIGLPAIEPLLAALDANPSETYNALGELVEEVGVNAPLQRIVEALLSEFQKSLQAIAETSTNPNIGIMAGLRLRVSKWNAQNLLAKILEQAVDVPLDTRLRVIQTLLDSVQGVEVENTTAEALGRIISRNRDIPSETRERVIQKLLDSIPGVDVEKTTIDALGIICGREMDVPIETREQVIRALKQLILTSMQKKIGDHLYSMIESLRQVVLDPQELKAFLDPLADEWFEEGKRLSHIGSDNDEIDRKRELAVYYQVLYFNPDHVRCLNSKAITHMQLKEWHLALLDIEKALTLDPNSEKAILNRYIPLWNMGRYDEALDALNRAIEFDPDPDLIAIKKQLLKSLGR